MRRLNQIAMTTTLAPKIPVLVEDQLVSTLLMLCARPILSVPATAAIPRLDSVMRLLNQIAMTTTHAPKIPVLVEDQLVSTPMMSCATPIPFAQTTLATQQLEIVT